jgi:hypothetical protein
MGKESLSWDCGYDLFNICTPLSIGLVVIVLEGHISLKLPHGGIVTEGAKSSESPYL